MQLAEKKELVFTSDWFSHNIPIWDKVLAQFKGKPVSALEIGSWEGRSACWLLENILTHDSARLTCVDNFEGNSEAKDGLQKGFDSDAIYKTFKANIDAVGGSSKTSLITFSSSNALKTLVNGEFDFIYIDGSHMPKDVLTDLVLAWPLLKKGGIMILDDYGYSVGEAVPKKAIDAFFYVMSNEIEKVCYTWQAVWRKK